MKKGENSGEATAKKAGNAGAKKSPPEKTRQKRSAATGAKTSVSKRAGTGSAELAKEAKKPKKTKKTDPVLETVKKCRAALWEKKAEDIKILDLRGKSPVADYFLIATATSEPHLRALSNELERTLKDAGVATAGIDRNAESGWVVVDAFDFMAHIFLPEQRRLYHVENLWEGADIIRA